MQHCFLKAVVLKIMIIIAEHTLLKGCVEHLSSFDKGTERRLSRGKRLSGALSPSLNNPMILIIHISSTQHKEQRGAGSFTL